MKKKKIIFGTLAGFVALSGLALAAFVYSGLYDMAAIHPHSRLVRPMLLTLKRNAVQFHARDLEPPDLTGPQLIKRGFALYRQNCVTCHGAPGEARSRVGMGLNPNPPPLEKAADEWTPAEIGWIITNGLKMAGMPGFALGEEPDDIWALTAFVLRMHTLTPSEYRKMLAATQGEGSEERVQWTAPEEGWTTLREKGDEDLGRKLIREFGCGSCHQIPGVSGARGTVGPRLDDWPERHYIAGALVNYPNSLVKWIMDPQQVEPGTVMPDLDVTEEEAWNIARYLYSLGKSDSGAVPDP